MPRNTDLACRNGRKQDMLFIMSSKEKHTKREVICLKLTPNS